MLDDNYLFEVGERRNLHVLENDLAPAGEDLDESTIEILEFPEHDVDAEFRVHNDHVHYEAQPGYEGIDSFTYRVCATNGLCDTATVVITISNMVPPPELCSGFDSSDIRFSFSENRQNSAGLDGFGLVLRDRFLYIFATAPETTETVSFYFDDPDRDNEPFFVDDSCTYDATIRGAEDQPTRAILLSQIGTGFHSLTIEVLDADGSTEIVQANFGVLLIGDPLPTPTAIPTPMPQATPTALPTPTPTATLVPTPTPTATSEPVPTATPEPTVTPPPPTATPVPTPTPVPVPTPTPAPTPTPDPNAVGADCAAVQAGGALPTQPELANCDLTDVTFGPGANLAGANLSGADLTKVNLDDADLTGAILIGAVLDDTKLKRATLTNADLTDAIAPRIKLEGANLRGSTFANADLTDARFGDATFQTTIFDGADLTKSKFGEGDGADASFVGATLEQTRFEKTKLQRVSFETAVIEDLELIDADVTDATFLDATGTPADVDDDTIFNNTTCADGTTSNDDCGWD